MFSDELTDCLIEDRVKQRNAKATVEYDPLVFVGMSTDAAAAAAVIYNHFTLKNDHPRREISVSVIRNTTKMFKDNII